MIRLVKTKPNRDKQLISDKGTIEHCEAGIIIHFKGNDKRCPNYAVLIDNESVEELVNGS